MFGTWTCHVCGMERLDCYISVRSTDVSEEHGLPRNNDSECALLQ